MEFPEASIDSFILKIWLEETIAEAGQTIWRGHITHVASGERHYLQGLDEIAVFILPYLEEMGIKFGFYWQLKQWLTHRKIERRSPQ